MKSSYRKVALLISLIMVISTLSACNNEISESSEIKYIEEISEAQPANILVVACDKFSGRFNPFYAETDSDRDVISMTSVNLLTYDSEGAIIADSIDGVTITYDGVDYKYNGLTDLRVTVNDDGSVQYDFELRRDVRFSDGEMLTVDDIIFTMYVLSDPSYEGPITFYSLPIKGLDDYRNGDAVNISGLIKNGESSFSLLMTEYDVTSINHLSFFIAPLHYYGNEAVFDYDNNCFGFEKGDISGIENNNKPLGAGAYAFEEYKNNIVYFDRNEYYYKGTPKIPFVEFREISDSKMLDAVVDSEVDIISSSLDRSVIEEVYGINGGTLSGDVLTTYSYDTVGYGYIGICADTVKVGDNKASDESKYLRKAFATVFSYYRESAVRDYYGESASLINYPISNMSWAAPNTDDLDYEIAYSRDINGELIYTEGMTADEKESAVINAAAEFFNAAGFAYDTDREIFVFAPEGASLVYNVIVPAEGKGNHPAYEIFESAKLALESIGITLSINDIEDSQLLWDALDSGTCQIWASAWNTTGDIDLYQLYHSSNTDDALGSTGSNDYDITDKKLDELIVSARTLSDRDYRNNIYKECFKIIFDWAVEIPVYQRKDAVIINNYSVDIDTVDSNLTAYKELIDVIHNIEMNS